MALVPTSLAESQAMSAPVTVEDIDAVIIGTGPSGLLASALLQGNEAFVSNEKIANHLQPELRKRLSEVLKLTGREGPIRLGSLDWPSLADGLQGRTNSPLCTLIDLLHMPGAEEGIEAPSAIHMQHDPAGVVPHVLVGPQPGGMWREMPGEWTTLSPGFWMALPGLSVREHQKLYPQSDADMLNTHDRMPRRAFLSYLKAYFKHMGLADNFVEGVATSLQRAENSDSWIVDVSSKSGAHRRFRARSVILATGSYASPRQLQIPGEHFPFVHHRSAVELGSAKRVLVVGAGLSASDFLVHLLKNTDAEIHHSFRSPALETKVGSKFARAGGFYSDYRALVSLMLGQERHQRYTPAPETSLVSISEQGVCLLREQSGAERTVSVDSVYLLIGATPDLGFVQSPALQDGIQHPKSDRLTNGSPNPHPVFVEVDMGTTQIREAEHSGLYALGPLRGANFVRFLVGDAFAVAWSIRDQRCQ